MAANDIDLNEFDKDEVIILMEKLADQIINRAQQLQAA